MKFAIFLINRAHRNNFPHGNYEEFILALNTVVSVKGITKLAKKAHLGRESLYKTLDTATKPRFETILKILNALDI